MLVTTPPPAKQAINLIEPFDVVFQIIDVRIDCGATCNSREYAGNPCKKRRIIDAINNVES
jgi:hypothetical protein